ncbi:hypothetical protein HCN44_003358 [Aphidius gifuensis]|uniref:Transposase domain-containing protein n=1 Tax=Aphidius gifuensis TaxID=684658 RepID=A0A834XXS5_APHGI|nr:hypothetical protein HCN44_003358 [Aphidius gifuensis]
MAEVHNEQILEPDDQEHDQHENERLNHQIPPDPEYLNHEIENVILERVIQNQNNDNTSSDTESDENSDEAETEDCEDGSESENEDNQTVNEEDFENSDDEEPLNACNYNQPLYVGAPITVAQSMAVIFSILMEQNVTQTCLEAIIKAINCHCIPEGHHKNSLFKFQKFFGLTTNVKNDIIKHFYCMTCEKALQNENDNCIELKGFLLIGTCDIPAKVHFWNLVSYNGLYGCPTYIWPGETYNLTPTSHTHVYPYIKSPKLRTKKNTIKYAQRALPNLPHKGVKGHCILASIMYDHIKGMASDRMHAVDAGTVKKLVTLWFDNKYQNEPYSLVYAKNLVDERLKKIKPPHFVHRMPSTIDELLHWKTSQFKMWFYYYALTLLKGIMREEYFQHFILLVAGITILDSDIMTHADINMAENYLHKFVNEFELKYGLRYCSVNIHVLLHLSHCVRLIGPLWAYSCYNYEDLNGQFLRLVHGTRHIESQIANAHYRILRVQRFFNNLPEGPVRDYCFSRRHGVKLNEKIFDNTYSVGTYSSYTNRDPVPAYIQCINHLQPIQKLERYFRLLKKDKLYISELYKRNTKTSSSCAMFKKNALQNSFCSIVCFWKVTKCQCQEINCQCDPIHYAVGRLFEYKEAFNVVGDQGVTSNIPILFECTKQERYMAIRVSRLQAVCVQVNVGNTLYLGIPVNEKEKE